MNDNENLLAARAEIEEILKRRNIAGHVILHMPGFFENFGFYTPSYSKVQPIYDADGSTLVALHIQSKLADYKGDAAAQKRDLEATSGMLSGMGMLLAQDAISLLDVAKQVDLVLGSQHTPLTLVTRPDRTK